MAVGTASYTIGSDVPKLFNDWTVCAFSAQEGLSQLTQFTVTLIKQEDLTKPLTAADTVLGELTSNPTDAAKKALDFAHWKKNYLGIDDALAMGTMLKPDDFLDKLCTVSIQRTTTVGGGTPTATRWFCGIITGFADMGNTANGTTASAADPTKVPSVRYVQLTVQPQLFRLGLRGQCRIFQNRSAVQIVESILREADLYQKPGELNYSPTSDPSANWTPPREYCVQYNETDLAFVQRLLESEGISYCFDYSDKGDKLYLIKTTASSAPITSTTAASLKVQPDQTAVTTDTNEETWYVSVPKKVTVGSWFVRDRNYFVADTPLDDLAPGSATDWNRYQYPAGEVFHYRDDEDSDPHKNSVRTAEEFGTAADKGGRKPTDIAILRLAAETVAATHLDGWSDGIGIQPGAVLTLTSMPAYLTPLDGSAGADAKLLVVSAQHWGQPTITGFTVTGGLPTWLAFPANVKTNSLSQTQYANNYQCISATADWHPPPVTPRPRIEGIQTATVVNAANETTPKNQQATDDLIACDVLGRVRVRFHWDRRVDDPAAGRAGEPASCWVRVAQAWAGDGWGHMVTPRVGMEVVVTFEEGDPERPLIIGCVYNGHHQMPTTKPYDPNKEKERSGEHDQRTKTMIRTRSQPGVDGATYDPNGFNELSFDDLKNHERVYVYAQRDLEETVKQDHKRTVGNDEANTIEHDQDETISRNQTLTVDGSRTKTVDYDEHTTITTDRQEWVFVNEQLTVRKSRQESVLGSEEITVGSGGTAQPNNRADQRSIVIEGNRDTSVLFDDTLAIQGDFTQSSHDSIHVTAKSLSIKCAATDPGGLDESIVMSDQGDVAISQKVARITSGSTRIDAGRDIKLKAHEAITIGVPNDYGAPDALTATDAQHELSYDDPNFVKKYEMVPVPDANPHKPETTAKPDLGVSFGASKVVITNKRGITLQCGDKNDSPVIKMTPTTITLSVGGKNAVAINMDSDHYDQMVKEWKERFSSSQSVYYTADAPEIHDQGQDAAEDTKGLPPPYDKHSVPGVDITGQNLRFEARTTFDVKSKKGVNVQNGKMRARVHSPGEDQAVKDAQKLQAQWEDAHKETQAVQLVNPAQSSQKVIDASLRLDRAKQGLWWETPDAQGIEKMYAHDVARDEEKIKEYQDKYNREPITEYSMDVTSWKQMRDADEKKRQDAIQQRLDNARAARAEYNDAQQAFDAAKVENDQIEKTAETRAAQREALQDAEDKLKAQLEQAREKANRMRSYRSWG